MLLSRLINVVLLSFSLMVLPLTSRVSAQENTGPSEKVGQDTRAANCRVTLPSDGVFEAPSPVYSWPSRTPDQFFFGTAGLWTVLPADGIWRGQVPSKPHEFAYDSKLSWGRTHVAFLEKDGPLTVRGKRIDGPGPSFIETFDSIAFPGEDGNAMVVSGISIPVFGCWEITGHYKDQELTFTVWVTSFPKHEQSSRAFSPPPARETAARRIQVDGETQAASLVYRVIPELPASAKAANVSATVVLHAVIGTDGRANELSYVSGPQLLVEAAMEAVRWWQYRIAVTNLGQDPYEYEEVDTTITVVFPAPGIEH
jgi:hypothetical protein